MFPLLVRSIADIDTDTDQYVKLALSISIFRKDYLFNKWEMVRMFSGLTSEVLATIADS